MFKKGLKITGSDQIENDFLDRRSRLERCGEVDVFWGDGTVQLSGNIKCT